MIRWFLADEAIKKRVAHRADHFRLGPEFSKCGKRLGADVTRDMVDRPAFWPCEACAAEIVKEAERAAAVKEAPADPDTAPKIVILTDSVIFEIAEKPRGVRVEVIKLYDDGGLLCDYGERCKHPRPHAHRFYYEEKAIPDQEPRP